MKDWTVSLSFAFADDLSPLSNRAKEVFLSHLAGRCPILGYSAGKSLDLTFDVLADDIETAVSQAKQSADDALHAAGLPPLPMEQLVISSAARREHDDQRIPDLVGIAEIAELLSTSRQRAWQISKTDSFPAPMSKLRSGPVWTRSVVENWGSSRRVRR